MENNKKIILIGGVLVIVVLFFVFKNVSFAPVDKNADKQNLTENKPVQINPELPGQTLPLSNDPKDLAWAVFEKYLGYNKAKNIEGVRTVVYKIASVCEDPKLRIDCEGRMGSAYAYGSALKKEDFTNIWSDDRQIILAADFKINEDDQTIGRTRSIIFFIIDENGSIKMLSFSPFKGATTSKGNASEEEYMNRIIRYTEDKDNDGALDYIEECIPADIKETCVPTDPKMRDTDADGLWDGVEALMK